jgi:hypothetical protein
MPHSIPPSPLPPPARLAETQAEPPACEARLGEDGANLRAVHRAGETVGIELYDHLIVTRSGFTSLRERGAF